MKIKYKIINTMKNYRTIIKRQDVLQLIKAQYPDTKLSSITIQDYCYNRVNKDSVLPLFEVSKNGYYKYLGENYLYTGNVYWNNNKVATWDNGNYKSSKNIKLWSELK